MTVNPTAEVRELLAEHAERTTRHTAQLKDDDRSPYDELRADHDRESAEALNTVMQRLAELFGPGANRRPYNAQHVQIVEHGDTVTALYIPDPEQAKDPRHVLDNITHREHADVERVATATRHYQSKGAALSGWIVRSGLDYTDPLPNRPTAMKYLRCAINAYFTP